MKRAAREELRLADGTFIPKGSTVCVANTTRVDPSIYDSPETFNGYRFMALRKTADKEHMSQFVVTSVESLGFGHGQRACPGRFFAANEAKVILCHLLLKYDIETCPGSSAEVTHLGINFLPNHKATVRVRRRNEGFDIDNLSYGPLAWNGIMSN